MNTAQKVAQKLLVATAVALLALPAAASAQVYYYAPNTTSGAFNYGSSQYIPSAAMPYVQMGQQIQRQMQQQYGGYSYPGYSNYSNYSYPMQAQYQYQSQSQYQNSYPSYDYNTYSYPTQQYSYSSNRPVSGYYMLQPQSYSYPSDTYGPFGTQLCYWSDYTTYAPCGRDPQQWVQDPYTGRWY